MPFRSSPATVNVFTALLLSALLSACASAPKTAVDHSQALSPSQVLHCIEFDSASPEYSAADLAGAAQNCVHEGRFDNAAELVLVASAFAHFDTLRVSDSSAHSAQKHLFSKHFLSLDNEPRDRLLAAIYTLDQDSDRKALVCRVMSAMQPPQYLPLYMIAHGKAAQADNANTSLHKSYDAEANWLQAQSFVRCET